MFNHVQIKVADLKSSRHFYITVLGTLGYEIVLDEEGVVGIGPSLNNMFEIRQASTHVPLSTSVHVAFVAKNADAVKHFYETAIQLGAKGNGKPGYRTEYGDGYFAAFVIGPEGHNLEAVFFNDGSNP